MLSAIAARWQLRLADGACVHPGDQQHAGARSAPDRRQPPLNSGCNLNSGHISTYRLFLAGKLPLCCQPAPVHLAPGAAEHRVIDPVVESLPPQWPRRDRRPVLRPHLPRLSRPGKMHHCHPDRAAAHRAATRDPRRCHSRPAPSKTPKAWQRKYAARARAGVEGLMGPGHARAAREQAASLDPARVRAQVAEAEAARRRAEAAAVTSEARAAETAVEVRRGPRPWRRPATTPAPPRPASAPHPRGQLAERDMPSAARHGPSTLSCEAGRAGCASIGGFAQGGDRSTADAPGPSGQIAAGYVRYAA